MVNGSGVPLAPFLRHFLEEGDLLVNCIVHIRLIRTDMTNPLPEGYWPLGLLFPFCWVGKYTRGYTRRARRDYSTRM